MNVKITRNGIFIKGTGNTKGWQKVDPVDVSKSLEENARGTLKDKLEAFIKMLTSRSDSDEEPRNYQVDTTKIPMEVLGKILGTQAKFPHLETAFVRVPLQRKLH